MDHATLIVSRTSEKDLKFRGIEILVDGNFVGNLLFGDTIQVEIPPGTHVLKATNRFKSSSADFEAEAGQTIHFETTGIVMGGLWIVITMTGTVAYRVTLERLR